jgi:hypothetical protein
MHSKLAHAGGGPVRTASPCSSSFFLYYSFYSLFFIHYSFYFLFFILRYSLFFSRMTATSC